MLVACVSGIPAGAQSTQPFVRKLARQLILVRHGAYDTHDPRGDERGGFLTDVGVAQAKATAHRLRASGLRVDSLFCSPLPRASQTGSILADSLGVPALVTADLAECAPHTENPKVAGPARESERDSCDAQIERMFHHLFHPPAGRDERVVVTAHGNVLRRMICLALGYDPNRWLRLELAHCALTVLEVSEDGSVRLVSLDDVGHLPVELRTYYNRGTPMGRP